ncbi:MAG: HD domain-containing protein [Chloroflexi bacterium]|nr:HD domain-containing protein [Chloroflexota bacterium]
MAHHTDLLAELLFLEPPARTHLRDAVWSAVPLGRRELALLDTLAFQRLRRVQQLGFISWVFPGAHHTRFEHSIGVHHLTRRALVQLIQRFPNAPLDVGAGRATLAAALLHDIGHYPFSHAVEELAHPAVRRHEAIAVDLISSGQVAEVLRSEWGIEPARVARLVARDAPPDLSDAEQIGRDLLSGALDTDKLDYLVRDAHYCNVPYGLVDVERLLQTIRLWCDPVRRWRLVVDEHGIGPIQSLVFARYLMFYNVYWHHAARIATVMFLRAVEDALDLGTIVAGDLEHGDDASILASLLDRSPAGSSVATLARALLDRRLYKRAVTLTPTAPEFEAYARLHASPAERRALERAWCQLLAERLGRPLAGYEVLIDVPERRNFSIPLEVLADGWAGEPEQPRAWGDLSGLSADDMARFHRAGHHIRIVAADHALAAAVRAHWRDFMSLW